MQLADAVQTAHANATALQAAQQELARLEAQCIASNAFAVEHSQLDALDAMLRSIDSSIARARGGTFLAFWLQVRFATLTIRLILDAWSVGSGIPAFLFAIFFGTIAFGATLLLAVFLQLPGIVAIAAPFAVGGTFFGVLAALIGTLPTDSARCEREQLLAHCQAIAALTSRRSKVVARRSELLAIWKLRTDYDAANREVGRLIDYFKDRRNQLLVREWRHLRGIEFELFLAEVFGALGFAVSTTRTTGDQGVDLIASKGELRIAIQAKGYAGSVGNEAVQQAFAGMRHYRCNRCAVVTNSEFTRSAMELSSSVDCLLVDGESLPRLIAGDIF